ncbi:hypothetical protein V3C99_010160 [Haemonchus contortus]|uniref:Sushi domain-containing protein n=1 Tax=Haemonchus placei TaxID=6290 RepID=A0A158QLI1_HAEPC|nr:unnamed protein product [Haemonchus placei]
MIPILLLIFAPVVLDADEGKCKLNELYDIFTNVTVIHGDEEARGRNISVPTNSTYQAVCILDPTGMILHKGNYTCVHGQWRPKFVRLPFCRHSEFYRPPHINFDYY